MYLRNDASEMVIQYNYSQETQMPGTSLPADRQGTSDLGPV
ncbi:hypothetical protein [Aquiflexum sp.]